MKRRKNPFRSSPSQDSIHRYQNAESERETSPLFYLSDEKTNHQSKPQINSEHHILNQNQQNTPMGSIINCVGIINVPDDDDVSILYSTPPPKPNNVIFVEHYSGDFQLSIMASLHPQKTRRRPKKTTRIIDLDDEVQFLHSLSPPASFKPKTHSVIIELGDSSNSTVTFVCEICTDTKPYSDSFTIMGCTHSYCSDCIAMYVSSKLDQNITQIPCPVPDCSKGVLHPDHCRTILRPNVFDRWGIALCESQFQTSEKFYCPFKDCSALMIDDCGGEASITEAECWSCNRLFCAQCKVPWHLGIQCSEYQTLHKDERGREDIMLMKLAKEKKWTRCPKCKVYVEKTEGCLFMLCRCRHTFCYNCGAFMKEHYCYSCKR